MNDAFGHPQSVVVLGGTSDIARELVALLVADRGRSVVLAGRDRAALEQAAKKLRRSVARVRDGDLRRRHARRRREDGHAVLRGGRPSRSTS